MIIGVPRELKNNEARVGLTPDNVREFINHGHTVKVEEGAGIGSHFADEQYATAGAKITTALDAWDADMVIKVKEPLEEEYAFLKEDQILYAYLHLAVAPELTQKLLEKNVTSVAYETLTGPAGDLPCLTPMSDIAGRLAIMEGMKYLQRQYGGKGVLLPGVPGIERGKVVIVGGGGVGTAAAHVAVGIGADVTVLDVNLKRLSYLTDVFKGSISTLYSNRSNIRAAVKDADLVVGAVLLPGRQAPKLVLEEDIKAMSTGSVVVDVAIDQGGCIETSRPTTHDDPVFVHEGVVHYCVSNMPGAVPRTSTLALTNATLNPALQIADLGLEEATRKNPGLANGINLYRGKVTHKGVAEAVEAEYTPLNELLG